MATMATTKKTSAWAWKAHGSPLRTAATRGVLRFSYSSGPLETRRALDLIASGRLPVERLVTHRLPLARTAEAFALAEAGGEALKVVVDI